MTYIDDRQTQISNSKYISDSMKEPMLTKEHEYDLINKWQNKGDEKALHELVNSYKRLVISTAMRFKFYGLPVGDLIQEGNIGLMQSANKFDISKDVRFSTYATWWIRAAVQDYVLRNWSIVRTGTTAAQKSLFFNLRRVRAKLEAANDGRPLDDEGRKKIATDLKVRTKDITDMEGRLYAGDRSLNATIGEENETNWQDLLADERHDPEEVLIGTKDADTRSAWLNTALGGLNEREQTIIRKRHLGDETVTLEVLGNDLGISKERVRQIESAAMGKLKISMGAMVENTSDLFMQT